MQTLRVAKLLHDDLLAPELRVRGVRLFHDFAHQPVARAVELEGEVNGVSCGDALVYHAHLRRLAFNLACNAELARVAPDALVHMTDDALAAGTIVQRVKDEEQQQMDYFSELLREKYENVVKAQKSESLLKCRRCGSSEITYNQKQVRGADEASSVFCTCLGCKKRWRLG